MTEYRRQVVLCRCGIKIEKWQEVGIAEEEPWTHIEGQKPTVPCSTPEPVEVEA